MIGSVRGTVIERTTSGEVLIEVGGVGYRVNVPLRVVPSLDPGSNAFLFTHLHVREDAMTLYGFPTRDERDTYEVLIGATGVGPKLALAILSVHTPNTLRRGLADDDLDALILVPGVGKRTAQRLIIELKARLELPDFDLTEATGGQSTPRGEVREALVGLGYSVDEVRGVLGQLTDEATGEVTVDVTVEELLRDALRVLAGSR